MPSYVVHSDGPISVREVNRPEIPDRPDWGVGGGPILPEDRWIDRLPPDVRRELRRIIDEVRNSLPDREDWPPLPPIPPDWRDLLGDHIGRPIIPMPPDPEVEPPPIWPPLPEMPDMPDLTGKTLVLATFHISRKVHFTRWVLIDHAECKAKLEALKQKIKDKLPAGGVGGRPPERPGPGGGYPAPGPR